MRAKLRFSYGTMASGKSLQVLTTVYNFEQRDINCLIIKSAIDTRDGDEIKSRIGDGISRECILVDQSTNIYDFFNNTFIKNTSEKVAIPSWVFVDEAQFLTEEQVDQLSDIVDYLDIDVWCFGLRTDFKTHLFPGSKRLFEIADKVEELKSSCSCGRKNTVNARLTKEGKLAISGGQIMVGAEDKYSAICRKCYKQKLKEQQEEIKNN